MPPPPRIKFPSAIAQIAFTRISAQCRKVMRLLQRRRITGLEARRHISRIVDVEYQAHIDRMNRFLVRHNIFLTLTGQEPEMLAIKTDIKSRYAAVVDDVSASLVT